MADFNGSFLWYELMTEDVAAAKAFYSEVIGWGTQDWEDGPKPYTMWTTDGNPMGGLMKLPDEAKAQGAPPHWMAHIGTSNLDATVDKIKSLGGVIHAPPFEVPTVGRFAIFADPSGAVSSAFEPAGDAPNQPQQVPGSFCWNELWSSDPEKAWAFHAELWGWTKGESMEPQPGQVYQMFNRGEVMLGGYCQKQPEMPGPSAWLYYITVKDLDVACEQVKTRGGQVVNGPMDIPGGGRVAQCVDPQGAAFALHIGPS